MAEERIEAEELPYITLLRKVPIKFIEWADKEIPTTYLIGNCSNNKETYDQSITMLKKADFYKALKQLKPKAEVKLMYEEAGANQVMPGLEGTREVTLEFEGRDILTREGIYQRMVETDSQFRTLAKIKGIMKIFQKFVEQNRNMVQSMLKQKKFTSPWEVFRELMKEDRLKVSFFTMVENQLGKDTKGVLLEKWEKENG